MLVGVEQKVAASADAEEILTHGHALERRAVCAIEQLLPASADGIRGPAVTALRDEIARRHDVAPRDLAVEAEQHDTAGPQHREQRGPAAQRSRKRVPHCSSL